MAVLPPLVSPRRRALNGTLAPTAAREQGSWYRYNGQNLAQGRLNTVAYIKENAEVRRLYRLVVAQGACILHS
jgi:hypothetical protein